MSPPRNREQRQQRERQPRPQQREDGDEGDEAVAAPGKPLTLTGLQHSRLAIDARWNGDAPNPVNLDGSEKDLGPSDPACLAGKTGGAHCRHMGSINIAVQAAAAHGAWRWIARACALQRTLGCNLVEPFGADSTVYLYHTARCYLLAERELRRVGDLTNAEHCRLAYRSIIVWLALCSIPQPRLRDRVIAAGEVTEYRGKPNRLPGVAHAGPRFSTNPRAHKGGLSTDNAGAKLLAYELGTVDGLGCNKHELDVVRAVIEGEVGAAQNAATWAYGTLPGWAFRWRRVRTDQGDAVENVYTVSGGNPNPYKPSFAAGQMLPDGTSVRMTPARRNAKNDAWGAGTFKTVVEDGMIRSSCGDDRAEVPELVGRDIWRLDIDGEGVELNGERVRAAA